MSNKIPFPFLALDLNGNYPALDFAFPCGSAGQEFTCNVEDLGSIWVGKIPWRRARLVLEKTLESPLHCKEIQPVHPKDHSWVFIGRTGVEAETPVLWPPDAKC